VLWNGIRFDNPFQTTEIVVLTYLCYLFQIGKSYSVINLHKAMLLQTLPLMGNTWCENCNLITRFMKGVFMKMPPKPRYNFTWDVTPVLKFLSSLFPLESLSLKLLTFKVVALIALAAAPRAQTLVAMDIDYMLKEKQCVIVGFPSVLKTSRIGHSYNLKIEHYKDEKLCAMHTMLFYLSRTESVRLSRKLLISYVTFKSVSTSTVARWLRTVLDLSGIDTNKFKAHSFRGASVSKALVSGCSLQKILRTADWSSDKNFRKFYYRHTISKENMSFADSVFK
jgi:hypothetical protein